MHFNLNLYINAVHVQVPLPVCGVVDGWKPRTVLTK